LLFFGLVKRYKGLDTLLKAFTKSIEQNLKIKLIIAGEFYEDRKIYDELISELNINDQIIIFDEYIPAEKVKFFFSACDLVIQPYKTATQSGVTQVAYHFNKPMIVTDVGGLKEIVPNGKVGFVVEKENPEQIAEAINKFFKENQVMALIENIKQEKLKFSWDAMAKGFKSLLAEIKKP
ncbi:MAG: glycosyltransferase, partial [Bacteroidales bacterium]|nr:glycosyltransferase [Bacteroidales bacterium]